MRPDFPGVPSDIQESMSSLTESEKYLSTGDAIVGTGDLRKLLLKQQKDHSRVLKAYLTATKKMEGFKYSLTSNRPSLYFF